MRRNAGAAEKREDFAQKRGSLPQNTAGMCRYLRCFFVAAPLRECQLGRYARTGAQSAGGLRTKELTRGFRPTDAPVHHATRDYGHGTSACGAAEKRRARHFAVSGCTMLRYDLLQLPYVGYFEMNNRPQNTKPPLSEGERRFYFAEKMTLARRRDIGRTDGVQRSRGGST